MARTLISDERVRFVELDKDVVIKAGWNEALEDRGVVTPVVGATNEKHIKSSKYIRIRIYSRQS